MNKEELKRVCKTFLKEKVAGLKSGVGIGLATAKELCQSLDGDIQITSVPNNGATVTFTVKVSEKYLKKIMDTAIVKYLGDADSCPIEISEDYSSKSNQEQMIVQLDDLRGQMVRNGICPQYYYYQDCWAMIKLAVDYKKNSENELLKRSIHDSYEDEQINQSNGMLFNQSVEED